MQKGHIGVTTENIFPIIKKFLYSEHEIFLRELISNATDATQKLKTLSSIGDFKGDIGKTTIEISVDKKANTLTVSDRGIGMTNEEIEKYINQIAFSSAEEFLDKYKNKTEAIIGHFGLGFYSSFMVSEKVEIITKSYKEGEKAMKWSCDGTPEYTLEETEKKDRGTDIILHLDKDSKEYLEEPKINELLTKYCKFLPVEISFGKKKEWKDGKEVETEEDNIINNTNPLWAQKPVDLKDEDYNNFYKELYPGTFENPLFNIHLNVDYPFNLTGILYFPKIRERIEVQKNKIQLYCNQVFVTDSVEGIVPEFLTLLHGVIDSPDIPLNVSRSYLQGDPNVKKISSHITKKVADRLAEIFKTDREQFENKWDDLKTFIEYGILTDEKFYDRAKKFSLLKNTDGKYFTFEEYDKIIKDNQTDKDKKIVYIYCTNTEEQYSYIEKAKEKGYDILLMDGHLDAHYINHLETKLTDVKFVRVDAEVVDKLVQKEDAVESKLSQEEINNYSNVFRSQCPAEDNYLVNFEQLGAEDNPIIITQSEFMRRMKDMSSLGGGGMGFYGDLPNSFNLVVNTNHKLINKILDNTKEATQEELNNIKSQLEPIEKEKHQLEEAQKDKKEEEIPQADKDKLDKLRNDISDLEKKKTDLFEDAGKNNKLVKQVIDLALLANNMLKGEALTKFVKRSVDLID